MLTGAESRWRMILICSRAFSTESIAHGSEPSAPPCAAAMTRSASITPAIGASTIGKSVLKRSRRRRSGHMVFLFGLASGSGDEIAAAEQELLGFGDDAFNDLGGRWNIMNQADRLAGKDDGNVEIAGGSGSEIFWRHRPDLLHQFHLVAGPAPYVVID